MKLASSGLLPTDSHAFPPTNPSPIPGPIAPHPIAIPAANNANALKNSTYECGEVPRGEAHIQFHFQYYMFAILFVVFDLVVVFLILWVQVYLQLEVASKVVMLLFLFLTLLGLWYAFRKENVIWI